MSLVQQLPSSACPLPTCTWCVAVAIAEQARAAPEPGLVSTVSPHGWVGSRVRYRLGCKVATPLRLLRSHMPYPGWALTIGGPWRVSRILFLLAVRLPDQASAGSPAAREQLLAEFSFPDVPAPQPTDSLPQD